MGAQRGQDTFNSLPNPCAASVVHGFASEVHGMKQALVTLLAASAVSILSATAPAIAQVAGNPGDLHSLTPYIAEQRAYAPAYYPGYAGPSAPAYGALPHTGCGAWQDFNGRYTAACAP